MGSHVEHAGAHRAEQQRRGEREQRRPRERAEDVVEDALHACGEDRGLARLGLVGLHDAHAGQRLGEAARHLGVDPAPLTEDRPEHLHRAVDDEPERAERHDRQQRHALAQAQHDRERERRGQQPAKQLDETGADQVLEALDVVHDPRHQLAGLSRVVERHGQPAHVLLDPDAHLRDQPLRGFRDELDERVGADSLERRGTEHPEHEWPQPLDPPAPDHVVDEEAGRDRQEEPRRTAHRHQQECERQHSSARPHERPDLRQQGAKELGADTPGLLFRELLGGSGSPLHRGILPRTPPKGPFEGRDPER